MTVHKTAVLGIGNPLRRDDGVGIRVIQLMQAKGKYPSIDIIDGGTSPDLFSLLDEDTEKLIVVDALRTGGTPGHIFRLKLNESNIAEEPASSMHGLGLLDSLKMMVRLGIKPPEVTIIGIEPCDVSNGLNLSPQIEAMIPDLIAAVEEELSKSC